MIHHYLANKATRARIVSLTLLTVGLAGCGGADQERELRRLEVRKFYGRLADSFNDLIHTKRGAFISALKPFMTGQGGDKAQLRVAYYEYEKTVKHGRQFYYNMPVPDSENGQELLDAYQRFLDVIDSVVLEEFRFVTELVEKREQLDPLDKELIQASVTKFDEADSQHIKAVQEVATRFEQEFKNELQGMVRQ